MIHCETSVLGYDCFFDEKNCADELTCAAIFPSRGIANAPLSHKLCCQRSELPKGKPACKQVSAFEFLCCEHKLCSPQCCNQTQLCGRSLATRAPCCGPNRAQGCCSHDLGISCRRGSEGAPCCLLEDNECVLAKSHCPASKGIWTVLVLCRLVMVMCILLLTAWCCWYLCRRWNNSTRARRLSTELTHRGSAEQIAAHQAHDILAGPHLSMPAELVASGATQEVEEETSSVYSSASSMARRVGGHGSQASTLAPSDASLRAAIQRETRTFLNEAT